MKIQDKISLKMKIKIKRLLYHFKNISNTNKIIKIPNNKITYKYPISNIKKTIMPEVIAISVNVYKQTKMTIVNNTIKELKNLELTIIIN